jgi:hypothetical protein
LIQRFLNAGIKADYTLMDTRFATDSTLKDVLETGLYGQLDTFSKPPNHL